MPSVVGDRLATWNRWSHLGIRVGVRTPRLGLDRNLTATSAPARRYGEFPLPLQDRSADSAPVVWLQGFTQLADEMFPADVRRSSVEPVTAENRLRIARNHAGELVSAFSALIHLFSIC
jgi:hypothetical protein